MIRSPGTIVLVAALASWAAVSSASDTGGHRADAGALVYMQDGNRAGMKAEVRYNLAPEETNGALYVSAGLGAGSWFETRRPSGFTKVVDAIFIFPFIIKSATGAYEEDENRWTEIRTQQSPFVDMGLGANFGIWSFGTGLTWVRFDTDVTKLRDGVYYSGSIDGTRFGGWGQTGFEIGIGRWFLDLMFGFRQTRHKIPAIVTSSAGATDVAMVRPVHGLYGLVGLRYRF